MFTPFIARADISSGLDCREVLFHKGHYAIEGHARGLETAWFSGVHSVVECFMCGDCGTVFITQPWDLSGLKHKCTEAAK